jgi:GntR family transcriptional regulator
MSSSETPEQILTDFACRNRVQLTSHFSIPLYYQLYRILQKLILERGFPPGDQFPPEEVVALCFGISRPTANKAIQELVDQGWLVRERGRGTFVTQKPAVELTLLYDSLSLTEQFWPSSQLKSRLVKCKRIPATSELSRTMRMAAEKEVLYLRRVRFVNDRPIMVCDSYLPAERFPHLGEEPFIRGSLYATLEERYGCSVMESDRHVEAAEIVEHEIAELLETSLFSPILLLKGLTFTKENVIIEYMVSHIGEGVSFKSTVSRASDVSTVSNPTKSRQGE